VGKEPIEGRIIMFVSTRKQSITLIKPYGGNLINLLVGNEERTFLLQKANNLPSVRLSYQKIRKQFNNSLLWNTNICLKMVMSKIL